MSATETETSGLALHVGDPTEQVDKPAAGDQRFWSVTTALGCLHKEGIVFWAAEQAAKAACGMSKSLATRINEDGLDVTVKHLRDARFRRPKDELSDKEFGTQIHRLAEEYALTGVKPTPTVATFQKDLDAANACLDRFDEWLAKFQPEYQATEVVLYTPTYGVAGTCDAFLTIDGTRFIVDYKSSKKSWDAKGKPSPIYPETALQLAAYRWSEFAAVWRPRVHEQYRRRYYLLSEFERKQALPVPEVDRGLGIKITPEHCHAYPVRCGPAVHEAFLFVLEAARWHFETSKDAIGEALVAPEES